MVLPGRVTGVVSARTAVHGACAGPRPSTRSTPHSGEPGTSRDVRPRTSYRATVILLPLEGVLAVGGAVTGN